MGEDLEALGYADGIWPTLDFYCVKVPVFSTAKLDNVEVSLSPEMRSTGEVLGLGKTRDEALYKGFLAAGWSMELPKDTGVVASINDQDKPEFTPIAKKMQTLGYHFMATVGTAAFLKKEGLSCSEQPILAKEALHAQPSLEGYPIRLVINTPTHGHQANRGGFQLRRQALAYQVPIKKDA